MAVSLLNTDSLTGNRSDDAVGTTVVGHMPGLIKLSVHIQFNPVACFTLQPLKMEMIYSSEISVDFHWEVKKT
jgi:hypothetical protein